MGEDRVGRALAEVVQRGELQTILLSAEQLEAEATRVVPRPAGYPAPYNAAQSTGQAVASSSTGPEPTEASQWPTLPIPLPSQARGSSPEGAGSGGRQDQVAPEDWSAFEAQEASLQDQSSSQIHPHIECMRTISSSP